MRGKAGRAAIIKDITRTTPAYAGKSQRTLAIQDEPQGSPPRMRGNGRRRHPEPSFCGITPAYARKSHFRVFGLQADADYPRVCGEKASKLAFMCNNSGSLPHMRGKDFFIEDGLLADGITPAYAGKRLVHIVVEPLFGDHPRICGEKFLKKS